MRSRPVGLPVGLVQFVHDRRGGTAGCMVFVSVPPVWISAHFFCFWQNVKTFILLVFM